MIRLVRVLVMATAMSTVLTACLHRDPKPNYSSAPVTVANSLSAPAGTTSATAAGAVPVDQIPPGNPASWVPTGVPTTGPYLEPGDEVPKFTPEMFTNTAAGARASALYYIASENWSIGILDGIPFTAICDAEICSTNAARLASYRTKEQHVLGEREIIDSYSVLKASSGRRDTTIFQVKLAIAAGSLVDDRTGRVLARDASTHITINLSVSWNERMWRLTDVAWVR